MNEYISVQEAIEKINERTRETFTLASGYEYYLGALHDVADDLRQMPTIDAVPVVRCKDCKHRDRYECNHIRLGETKCGVTDDWYCADGERKEE